MALHGTIRRWDALALVLVLGLGLAGLWVFGRSRTTSDPGPAAFTGAFSSMDGPSLEAALERLRWEDIAAVVEGTGTSAVSRQRILQAAQRSSRPEVVYLRGLLLLALERRGEALDALTTLDPSDIPPDYLYAPYRLHAVLRAGRQNPFSEGLRQALALGQLPPLIEARISAEDGELERALRSYLKTDPAQWATRDVELIRLLGLHAGLAPEVTRMVAGALRAGRVRAEIRPAIAAAAQAGKTGPTAAEREALVALLKRNPEARGAAVAAATRELRARQHFLKREFQALIADYRGTNPLTLSHTTLLMLVVASSDARLDSNADIWRQELRRRYPQDDVWQWLEQLRAPSS